MGDLLGEGAHLCKLSKRQFLPLRGLLQLTWVLLGHSQLLLQLDGRVELRLPNLPNRTVTDEGAHAKNVGNHCLIVRLAEHESGKFPNSSEEHHDMICSLSLVTKC